MCKHCSCIKHKGADGKIHILYLDDHTVFSKDGNALRKLGAAGNDFLGHGAVRAVYGLKKEEGRDVEVRDFWNAHKLPEELRDKFKDFPTWKKNFGRMFEMSAQVEDLEYIIGNAPKHWADLKAWCEELLATPIAEVFPINSRDDQSVSELVLLGKYDYKNPDINDANFPSQATPSSKKEAILLRFRGGIDDDKVEATVSKLGYRLGVPKEGLSFGIDHPKKQERGPILVLGQERARGGDRRVVVLYGNPGYRGLYLYGRGHRWGCDYRVLVFRK